MEKATIRLGEETGFHFDECYICPYHDDNESQERTVKALAESARKGCPACFVHHHTVLRSIPNITPDDKVFRDHADPFTSITVGTPNDHIQWRNTTYFILPPKALRE